MPTPAWMPYTGGDADEIMPEGGAPIGNLSVDGGTLQRIFELPASKVHDFCYSMFNIAQWYDSVNFVAKRADVNGMPTADGPPVMDPGSGTWNKVRITLYYEPVNSPSGGSGTGSSYERTLDFTETVISPPGLLWFDEDGAGKPLSMPAGTIGKPVSVLRFVYAIKGLSTFSVSTAAARYGRIDTTATNVKASSLQVSQTYYADGTKVYNVTVGLDRRDQDWNKFWMPRGAWDYFYRTRKLGAAGRQPIKVYDNAAVLTWVGGFGVDVSDVA